MADYQNKFRRTLNEEVGDYAQRALELVKLGIPSKSQEQLEQIRRLAGEGMSNYAIGKALVFRPGRWQNMW